MKKISIVTLQEIINESKNDLTVDEYRYLQV